MPVVSYVDPDSIHNPTAGGTAPATWFTTVEADFRSILGKPSARIYNDTAEDFSIPGPTTISMPDTDWNNGMTVGSNAITVPSSYGGRYWIIPNLRVVSVPSGANSVTMAAAVNGTDVVQEIASRSTGSGSLNTFARAFTYSLSVGDAVTVRVTTSGLSDADTELSAAYSSLTVIWLHA